MPSMHKLKLLLKGTRNFKSGEKGTSATKDTTNEKPTLVVAEHVKEEARDSEDKVISSEIEHIIPPLEFTEELGAIEGKPEVTGSKELKAESKSVELKAPEPDSEGKGKESGDATTLPKLESTSVVAQAKDDIQAQNSAEGKPKSTIRIVTTDLVVDSKPSTLETTAESIPLPPSPESCNSPLSPTSQTTVLTKFDSTTSALSNVSTTTTIPEVSSPTSPSAVSTIGISPRAPKPTNISIQKANSQLYHISPLLPVSTSRTARIQSLLESFFPDEAERKKSIFAAKRRGQSVVSYWRAELTKEQAMVVKRNKYVSSIEPQHPQRGPGYVTTPLASPTLITPKDEKDNVLFFC